MKPSKDFFSIRQVTELTGVTEFLLRIWENRYRSFQPKRTATGRRLYTREDVLRAKAMFDLTQRGHRIGSIARLSLPSLEKLLAEPAERPRHPPPAAGETVGKVLGYADRFQWEEARELICPAGGKPRGMKFLKTLILPLLREIGGRVENRTLNVAQEHILSAFIKEGVSAIRPGTGSVRRDGFRIVFAAPEGDFHDLGLLIASRMAALCGHQTLFLGANMPKRELSETCIRFRATHLLLSSTARPGEGAKEELMSLINFLDRHLPPSVILWLAGPAAGERPPGLKRSSGLIRSMDELESLL